jgi:hypothetical protein
MVLQCNFFSRKSGIEKVKTLNMKILEQWFNADSNTLGKSKVKQLT